MHGLPQQSAIPYVTDCTKKGEESATLCLCECVRGKNERPIVRPSTEKVFPFLFKEAVCEKVARSKGGGEKRQYRLPYFSSLFS